MVERSPEKAGVGGSTPSLATIIPQHLGVFAHSLTAQGSAQDTSLDRVREQVGLVAEQDFQELALCFEPRLLIGLRIQLHGRSDVFVRRMPCTVFGSHFSFTSEEASECRKLWKPKRTRSSSLITPALMGAGRRYFCTMMEADNGFLPLSRKLGRGSMAFASCSRPHRRSGLMFWFTRKKLSGSYFALMVERRS